MGSDILFLDQVHPICGAYIWPPAYPAVAAGYVGYARRAVQAAHDFAATPDDPVVLSPRRFTVPRPVLDVVSRIGYWQDFAVIPAANSTPEVPVQADAVRILTEVVLPSYNEDAPHASSVGLMRQALRGCLPNLFRQTFVLAPSADEPPRPIVVQTGYFGPRAALEPLYAFAGLAWPGL